jgi:hypothetical protein
MAFRPATGAPTAAPGDERAMWSEPPDLQGLIGSSEQILRYNLETEEANDLIPTEPMVIHVTWWGGYYNIDRPCDPGIPTPGFNLRFYENGDCLPASEVVEFLNVTAAEEALPCQQGYYPIYQYDIDVLVALTPGTHYWFSAQMSDHTFPPQWGRLASLQVVECASAFRSAYFGYPDWMPEWEANGFWWEYDYSQEFEGDHSEACCFPDAHCAYLLTSDCRSTGGVPQGAGTSCDPNPCASTPARRVTWGSVRALYR